MRRLVAVEGRHPQHERPVRPDIGRVGPQFIFESLQPVSISAEDDQSQLRPVALGRNLRDLPDDPLQDVLLVRLALVQTVDDPAGSPSRL